MLVFALPADFAYPEATLQRANGRSGGDGDVPIVFLDPAYPGATIPHDFTKVWRVNCMVVSRFFQNPIHSNFKKLILAGKSVPWRGLD